MVRITSQEPNLIQLEKSKDNDEIPLALLQENITLIIIDSDERNITTINGAQVQKAEISDLVQTIQRSLTFLAPKESTSKKGQTHV